MAKSVGRVLQELRSEAGLTVAALARAAHLEPAAISRIETGERPNVRFTTMCQLAAALGVSVDEIAMRAGIVKQKGVIRGGSASAPSAAALEGLTAVESLLEQARYRVVRVKKRISSKR